jgi:hypothetical protein
VFSAWLLVLVAGAARAGAQDYPPGYEAPGGCPEETEFRRTLGELLPEPPASPPRFVVSVVPAEAGFSLSILDANGGSVRTFDGPDCAALVGSAAVHLALFYQNQVAETQPVVRPPRPPPRIVPPPEPALPIRLRAVMSAGAGGAGLPGIGFGGALELGIELDFLVFVATGDVWPVRTIAIDPTGFGEFWRTSAGLDACAFGTVSWFRFGGCAGGGVAVLVGSGVQIRNAMENSAVIPLLRGRVRLEIDAPIRPVVAFDLEVLPVVHPFTLMDTGTVVFETPAFTAAAWVGVAGVLDLTR